MNQGVSLRIRMSLKGESLFIGTSRDKWKVFVSGTPMHGLYQGVVLTSWWRSHYLFVSIPGKTILPSADGCSSKPSSQTFLQKYTGKCFKDDMPAKLLQVR